jgi:hypothetical protein
MSSVLAGPHNSFKMANPLMATKVSEIDQYLRLPVESVSDLLKWWFDNCCVYPNLSCMALDYLSIPSELYCPDFSHLLIYLL